MEVSEIKSRVYSASHLQERFLFIENETLKANVAIAFQYVCFLLVINDEGQLTGPLAYSIYKDIVLHTACIIEGCLHYSLRNAFDKGTAKSSEVMPSGWKYEDNAKVIHKLEENRQIVGAIRYKSLENLRDDTDFFTINRSCKKVGILDESLYQQAEKIRKLRNEIHLVGLKASSDLYDMETINKVFTSAGLILNRIEAYERSNTKQSS